LSDKHCPVTFSSVTPVVLQDDNSDDIQCKEKIKRWCGDKCADFNNNIDVNKVDPIITDSALCNDLINGAVDNISNIVTEAAKK